MKHIFFVLLLFFSTAVYCRENMAAAQQDTIPTMLQKKRQRWVTAINLAGYGGTLIALNATWYNGYPRSSFHSFDDSGEWLQTDKLGHAWTAYTAARASTALWGWTGMDHKKAVLIGGLSGTAYLSVIEVLDGFSSKWGFSWADMGANIFGSGLFIAQELGWKEQRLQLKFSFHPYNYHDPQLAARARDLFGNTWYEKMLKDYNAQTYWLSANLRSFLPSGNLPPWLNIAIGYGADGMFGGFNNTWTDANNNNVSRNDIPRTREWFLAPDIDFTKIKTHSKFLRTSFSILNAFKFPAPALQLSKGRFKVRAVSF